MKNPTADAMDTGLILTRKILDGGAPSPWPQLLSPVQRSPGNEVVRRHSRETMNEITTMKTVTVRSPHPQPERPHLAATRENPQLR